MMNMRRSRTFGIVGRDEGIQVLVGFQPTIHQVDDAIGHIENAVVVGDHQNGAALFLGQVLHQGDHVPARFFVEGGGGLIRQNQLGLIDQGAGDRHPLLLPPREGIGLVIDSISQPHLAQNLDRLLIACCEIALVAPPPFLHFGWRSGTQTGCGPGR
jgi:hypothetical protein